MEITKQEERILKIATLIRTAVVCVDDTITLREIAMAVNLMAFEDGFEAGHHDGHVCEITHGHETRTVVPPPPGGPGGREPC